MRNQPSLALLWFCLVLPVSAAAQSDDSREVQAVGAVLDRFHQAAAAADWTTYFDLLTEDAIFLGTDASERWSKPVFREYAGRSNGWRYEMVTRHVKLTADGNTAWFDEILSNASYGTSRGSGVLVRTTSGWKLCQYHLTFPIPNPLAAKITEEIRNFEASR